MTKEIDDAVQYFERGQVWENPDGEIMTVLRVIPKENTTQKVEYLTEVGERGSFYSTELWLRNAKCVSFPRATPLQPKDVQAALDDLKKIESSINNIEADHLSVEFSSVRTALMQCQGLNEDTKRLDFLDSLSTALNNHYGTTYKWELVLNHNVNRLFFKSLNHIDLHDTAGSKNGLASCRDAIDRAMSSTTPPETTEE